MDATTVATITDAVTFVAIITGIGAVGAALVAPQVAMKGLRMLLSAIR